MLIRTPNNSKPSSEIKVICGNHISILGPYSFSETKPLPKYKKHKEDSEKVHIDLEANTSINLEKGPPWWRCGRLFPKFHSDYIL